MVRHSRIEVLPAARTEGLAFLVSQFLVQSAQKTLVIDTHGLEVAQLKLLSISAQLRCQSIALALELLLGDFECAELFQGLLTLNDLDIGVLVVSHHPINFNLVFGHHRHHFVAFGLAFAPISLVFKRDIDRVLIVTIGVLVLSTCLIRLILTRTEIVGRQHLMLLAILDRAAGSIHRCHLALVSSRRR